MMRSKVIVLIFLTTIGLLCSCQTTVTSPIQSPLGANPEQSLSSPTTTSDITPTILPTIPKSATLTPSPTQITPVTETSPSSNPPTPQPSPTSTFDPESWSEMPVIPHLSERVKEIFQSGLDMGNRPNAFSKVGDCGSTPSWFLGDFDRGHRFYTLGEYTHLQAVIDYYQGSFERTSLAALAGYNTSSVLTPLWSNKEFCRNDESPLACEYRIHRPTIALITLGANDVYHIESFEPQLRKIIEFSIEQGVIPVLATKPDNLEKDHRINRVTAQLAVEYQIPLWNYWRAVQPLPNHGLQEDGVHITFAANDFSNPMNMQAGWPIRNLTALQVLYALYTFLNSP
ncbi:MAG: SGNH/GDSL hydrolase family protein [Anaerolineales bacterium]|nr:SGNH/GDSL hydrolase family protein [Anaerolineales bacterium]